MSPALVSALPTVNALLNGTSAILLVSGYLLIRRRKVMAHRVCFVFLTGDMLSPSTRELLNRAGPRAVSRPCDLTDVRRVVQEMLEAAEKTS